ncbi:MAG: ABC transporter substrate-binding protein [Candidatus Bathyarchaeota archaeon]|nr:ABC transporter substrate-binding protein [Candidatus Bathyarchaeota archaeon]
MAVAVMLVAASLAGGAYFGYQSGYAGSQQQSSPEIQRLTEEVHRLTETNANVTSENEVLRKAASSIAGRTVKIGYIAQDTATYTSTKLFIEKVIQPDLNAYASSLGSGVSFEFMIMDAKGQANTHLELVQQLRSENVKIFIGSGWSSQGCSSLSYVNSFKMLMVSPSATSPSLAIANDRFYRMCTADTALPPALADAIWSYGIRELVIIQRGDSWGDGVVNLLTPLFTEKGGNVSQVVRYPAETTDFCPALQEARTRGEAAIARMGGDTSRVGVLLLAFDEAPQILKQVSQCEILYNLVWFGGDGTARSAGILRDSPLEANHLKLFSLLSQKPNSTKYTDLEARYVAATGEAFGIYRAYLNDAAWVLAKSILETGSDNATRVAAVLPSVCGSHYGATGWCRLNEYGDRAPPPYDIWYYAPGTTAPSTSLLAGTYYPNTRATTWNTR